MRVPVTVTIITKNEAAGIGDALASVAWADEIVVVDSESTDDTVAIAKRHTDRIVGGQATFKLPGSFLVRAAEGFSYDVQITRSTSTRRLTGAVGQGFLNGARMSYRRNDRSNDPQERQVQPIPGAAKIGRHFLETLANRFDEIRQKTADRAQQRCLDNIHTAPPRMLPLTIAQALIDTLTMLQEKTAGRLEADEEKLLTELLTAVRFRFVQTTPRSGGPA